MHTQINNYFVTLAVSASLVIFSSCDDGLMTDGLLQAKSDSICFTARMWNETGDESVSDCGGRSLSSPCDTIGQTESIRPMKVDNGEMQIYLHTEVLPVIGNDSTGDKRSVTSRGSFVHDLKDHKSFGVSSYVYASGNGNVANSMPWPMYDTRVEPDGNTGVWTPDRIYSWPGEGTRIHFYAYAPHGLAGVEMSPKTKKDVPYITYTIPTSNPSQTDLYVGYSGMVDGSGANGATLKFQHGLTAIQIVQGSNMLPGTVTRITLRGVYGKGQCNLSSLSWTPSEIKNFSLNYNRPVDGSSGKMINLASQTFFMIPQTLPDGAQLEINYTDSISGTPRVLKADIGGSVWQRGTTVKYRISTSSISVNRVLEVNGTDEFNHLGGHKPFSVSSYTSVVREGDETKILPHSWKAEFLEYDDKTKKWNPLPSRPDWISSFTDSGTGGEQKTFYCSVKVADETLDYSFDETLQSTPIINKTTPNYNNFNHTSRYNLSNPTGAADIVNTANCYIVNAPGAYTIPLVYGNAIKNGSTNTSAYKSSLKGDTILTTFVNHQGDPITDPFIYRNKDCKPKSARIIWRDSHYLVTETRVSTDSCWLTFNVKPENIKQGNAVVALLGARDGKEVVLWSWHIWVTPYIAGNGDKAVSNFGRRHRTFMPYNLGWCHYPAIYSSRRIKVRITQDGEDGLSKEFIITQNGASSAIDGNCPLYQFGRKDPMVPYERIGVSANKQWEANSGALISTDLPASKYNEGVECIAACIRNPLTFCLNEFMDGMYVNLWNPETKTIYDPSPVGYIMPDEYVFTGFTDTGTSSTNRSKFNVKGDYKNGWEFYCEANRGGETIFFPANGGRRPDDGKVSLGSPVYYRTGVNHSKERNYAKILLANDSTITPISSARKSWAYAVRPVRERETSE
ncbi:MAG: fimbrillin family protein [Muribaculaceae bacterium]|nr:fimbrillin family protein [Muribaculaceae bacterium]